MKYLHRLDAIPSSRLRAPGCFVHETLELPGLDPNGQATVKLRYHDDMKRPGLRRLLWLGKKAVLLIPDPAPVVKKEKACSFKVIGLASIAVGAAALGLFIGREFRLR